MAWRCYVLTVVTVVFGYCFQAVYPDANNITVEKRAEVICQTPECYAAAAAMKTKMNLSADPCNDFNEFACGRFLKEHVLADDESTASTSSILFNKNQFLLHDILVNYTNPSRLRYVKNMQGLFNSCVNETHIELLGLTPYFNDRGFADDWPTLNPHWSEASFDLNAAIQRYIREKVTPIFKIAWAMDRKARTIIIELRQPTFGLGQVDLRKPRSNKVIQAYEKYLLETAVALNASREMAARDAKDVVDLEIELVRIFYNQVRRDHTGQNNPIKLNQFSMVYPTLDIGRAIISRYSAFNLVVPDDEIVNNRFPAYIKNIESVLECFPKRTIQNLFGFKYALSRLDSLTQKMREIKLEFTKSYTGERKQEARKQEPRRQTCLDKTTTLFGLGLNHMFVNIAVSETAKSQVKRMVGELKGEFRKMIEEATWLSNSTKNEAFKKLAAIKETIGNPEYDVQEADVERLYENYTMSADNYYNNLIRYNEIRNGIILAEMRKPHELKVRGIWAYEPYAIAFAQQNMIEISAGQMLPPYYSESYPDYLNYGAIGTTIGHELTHLFDNNNRRFDGNGTRRNWWTKEDDSNFVNRSKCMVDQYSNFYIDEINMTLNGTLTQGEALSDTDGLKMAFRAYKQVDPTHSVIQGQLPDLNLSQDQLFFLSSAQKRCQKLSMEGLIQQVKETNHPPGKYRIIGTLQNSEDFARAYNCPRGSYMNPEKKCQVW